ncbi:hypothetical protein GQ53DRAFT_642540 [Thozetella sp. PMI_491]|nr:hypothetical protein GQ53DRAFT_642540 [Thozetella sp. PMI_491]
MSGEEEDDNFDLGGDIPAEESVRVTHEPKSHSSALERQCNRTIQLLNLAEGTTPLDIVKAVRGGMLLDVFIRHHERTANISFAYAADAQGFFNHVRKHDLYIRNKRLEIRWSDRQFILPGHVATAITRGASRNLIIRGCDARHTDASIRDDLDHIHNLAVVKIEFIGRDCYVGLNSVHKAISARSCMMSRLKYKTTRIEWDKDECGQSYERFVPFRPRAEPVTQHKSSALSNRFGILSVNDEEEDEISRIFQSKKPVGIVA